MLASSGGAARFVVVEKTDPLDATAISRVQALQDRLVSLGRAAGLSGVRFEVAGQTALIADSISSVFGDLGRVALAIVVVTLILLALFLRSLLAPVYLLAASVLAVFATLGVAMLICRAVLARPAWCTSSPSRRACCWSPRLGLQRVRGRAHLGGGPATAGAGRGRHRRAGLPRAITTAGVALAASFAMLAVIPLEQFRQLAITMAVGVILGAIAVRSLLVPALVALFGRLGMWPGNRLSPGAARAGWPAAAEAGVSRAAR